jgi:hypothetical protein
MGLIKEELKKQIEKGNLKMDNYVKEEQYIAEQVKANGQAVAELTVRRFEEALQYDFDGSASVIFEEEVPFTNVFSDNKGKQQLKTAQNLQERTQRRRISEERAASTSYTSKDAVSHFCW